jgi:isopentenyl diphosphate isomerase/L-lactate dehydrogenase-like FMN-dependent dehydrogenase
MCLSTLANASPGEVAALAPSAPRWFQLYWYRDEGVTRSLVEEATEAGFQAIVLTADAPVVAKRERDLRTGFAITPDEPVPSLSAVLGGPAAGRPTELFSLISPSVTWRDVAQLASDARLPVVVKGVLTAEDGRLALEHGAAAIVVSNHGGRQLDNVSATADALPEVMDEVGAGLEVYVDGGIRRGTDVAVGLALGARAVLVARPAVWGLAVGGEQGVRHVLEMLREELAASLAMLGCRSPAEVTRGHVARRV